MGENEIGRKLLAQRKKLGLTLEDVGKAVGVGKSTVRKWENGMIKNMGSDKLAALANVLEMDPVELVPGPTKKAKVPYIGPKTFKRSMAQTMVRAIVNDPAAHKEPVTWFVEHTNYDPQFSDMMKLWEVSSPQTKDSVIGYMKVMNSKKKE